MSKRWQIDLVRTDQAAFNEACLNRIARSARVWICRVRDWSALSRLGNLQHLSICNFKNADLSLLGKLKQLRRLELRDVPQMTDLNVFGQLAKLEFLELQIPMTSAIFNGKGNNCFIESLAPLTRLRRLKSLTLTGVRVTHGGLRPLESIRSLRECFPDNIFPVEECARFAAHRPDVKFSFDRPTWKLQHLICRKCQSKCVGLSGSLRRRWGCVRCDAARISEHVKLFRQLKDLYSR